MTPFAVFEPGGDAATALYIVSFSLFILGLNAWKVTIGVLGASVIVYLGCRLSGAMSRFGPAAVAFATLK